MDERIGKDITFFRSTSARAETLALAAMFLIAVLLLVRAFFGVDITDESFYISDALAMLHGNLPYALNNFFIASGYAFLPLPLLALYERLIPNCAGIVLFTRLCFLTFHFSCVFATVHVLKRHVGCMSARLFGCCLLPCISYRIFNFNYNSIPLVLLCVVAVLIYDAVERQGRGAYAALFFAGFLSAVSVFANPAYACAVLLNLLFIPLFSKKGEKLANLLLYMGGGILEILVVFIPLLLQTSSKLLWEGFEGVLTQKFPREEKSTLSTIRKIKSLGKIGLREMMGFAVALLVVPLIRSYARKMGKKPPDRHSLFLLWITVGYYLLLSAFLIEERNFDSLCKIGLAGVGGLFLILLTKYGRHTRLLLFLALYPLPFALMEVFLTSGTPLNRFFSCLPAFFCMLLILRECEFQPVRELATVCVVLCVLLQGFYLFSAPYRDSPLLELNTRVESGVYKGLFTDRERAEALQEMEEYLNGVVEQTDLYAFRDCFPSGYLMVHQGKMCDISSWDVLQYSYGLNTPARLFDYYRRSDSIPSVIIYVNYGRDKILSAEDDRVRYNDFLDAYYVLEDERFSRGLFSHIMVFRYAGGFDGDYESWINAYNFVSPEGNLLGNGQ